MSTTSSERAYHLIRGQILAGRYAGGERLKEEAVARDLALSRTPVRDAIRRLQAEGLVLVTPNAGARVASWTEGELAEITEMRARLESLAAGLAAAKIGAEGIAELSRLTDAMEQAIERPEGPDLDGVSARNLAFHRAIAAAAENGRLSSMVESLHSVPVVIRKFALFDTERLALSVSHHREIISALRARDADWAGALMRAHILAARGYDRLISDRRDPS
jgi:DNA-binding GntR family transcriptional regulator